jgi:hypothetical protein
MSDQFKVRMQCTQCDTWLVLTCEIPCKIISFTCPRGHETTVNSVPSDRGYPMWLLPDGSLRPSPAYLAKPQLNHD